MCDVPRLSDYRWSSYWYIRHPKRRPTSLDPSGALSAAGGLADTKHGHMSYVDYLSWLSTDSKAQKEMEFSNLCRGWALGSKKFKCGLLESEGLLKNGSFEQVRMEGRDLREVNELMWELVVA